MPSATAIHQKRARPAAKTAGREEAALRERLRELIKRNYGSVEKFAEVIGVSQSTVASWFGKRRSAPRADTLMLVARKTGWSVDELLGTARSSGLASELRAYLVREISDRAPRTSPETVLPSAGALLAEVMKGYLDSAKTALRGASATMRVGEIATVRYKLKKANTRGALLLLSRLEEATAKGEFEVALPEGARERRQAIDALIGKDPKTREIAKELGNDDLFLEAWFRHLTFTG